MYSWLRRRLVKFSAADINLLADAVIAAFAVNTKIEMIVRGMSGVGSRTKKV
jgi:hypothetical protein